MNDRQEIFRNIKGFLFSMAICAMFVGGLLVMAHENTKNIEASSPFDLPHFFVGKVYDGSNANPQAYVMVRAHYGDTFAWDITDQYGNYVLWVPNTTDEIRFCVNSVATWQTASYEWGEVDLKHLVTNNNVSCNYDINKRNDKPVVDATLNRNGPATVHNEE